MSCDPNNGDVVCAVGIPIYPEPINSNSPWNPHISVANTADRVKVTCFIAMVVSVDVSSSPLHLSSLIIASVLVHPSYITKQIWHETTPSQYIVPIEIFPQKTEEF